MYNVALCEIVGLTPTGNNFCIAYAFMTHEDTDTYTWVLNNLRVIFQGRVPDSIMTDRELGLMAALRAVFPEVQHLLCWLHVTRNCEDTALKITKNLEISTLFKNQVWGLFSSSTEESFERRRRFLHAHWQPFPGVMGYLETVWLIHRTSLVRCYTDHVLHFGTRTTNRYAYRFRRYPCHSFTTFRQSFTSST